MAIIRKNIFVLQEVSPIADSLSPEILSFNGLVKTLSQRTLTFHLNESCNAGDRILILGQNGCGKTTLLKILAGIVIPDQGTIKRNYTRLSWLPVCDLGFWPRLTGYEALSLYAKLWKVDSSYFEMLLSKWKQNPLFEESLSEHIIKLSTGKRQLLHFCRLQINNPEIILMDEPFRSLDIQNTIFSIEMFSNYNKRSLLIMSSPHPLLSGGFEFDKTWKLT